MSPPELPDDQTLSDMLLAQVRANGEGYVPGDGEYAAVAVVHADPGIQETIIPVRIVCTPCTDCDCGPCDGKVTRLTLRYDGPATNVRVAQKKSTGVIFNGLVQDGEEFTFSGTEKFGTMGTEITVSYGTQIVKIHTSCSQPIGPGLVFGPFTVISGESRNGGLLCTPGEGGKSDKSDKSSKSSKSSKSDKSSKSMKSAKSDKSSKSMKSTKSDKSSKSDK